jgi:hypothetical protein
MNQALNDLDDSQWQGLEPAAKNLMLAFTILPFLIPIVPAAVLPITLMPGWWGLAVYNHRLPDIGGNRGPQPLVVYALAPG